jgi:hypothetical protein
MITIGRMAEKYGVLPHVVEQNATTYDFMITDVLAAYDSYQMAKTKAKGTAPDPNAYKINQDQLQTILQKGKQNK